MKSHFTLDESTHIKILERQSTFIKFLANGKHQYRINFIHKKEFLIDDLECFGISITDKHPLLKEYSDTRSHIYISSKATNTDDLLATLIQMTKDEFRNWRDMNHYFNTGYHFKKIIDDGSGLLYQGPTSFGRKVCHALEEHGVTHKFSSFDKSDIKNYQVLLIGHNYIVAEDFHLKEIN